MPNFIGHTTLYASLTHSLSDSNNILYLEDRFKGIREIVVTKVLVARNILGITRIDCEF